MRLIDVVSKTKSQFCNLDYCSVDVDSDVKDFSEASLVARAVGGITLTVDKLSLLAPYIALVSIIAVAATTTIYFIRRKKRQ